MNGPGRSRPSQLPEQVDTGLVNPDKGILGDRRDVSCWGLSRPQFRAAGCLLVAKNRLKPLRNINRILAHRDASGGSRPPHHKRT